MLLLLKAPLTFEQRNVEATFTRLSCFCAMLGTVSLGLQIAARVADAAQAFSIHSSGPRILRDFSDTIHTSATDIGHFTECVI